jgi:hypothetical protein
MRLAALVVAVVLYDGFLLTDGHFDLFRQVDYGLTFNSMLLHMLGGQFDVDPWIIRNEGFLRDGLTYAYFGPLPALLRLPLLLWAGGISTDITGLSCLVALSISATMRLRTLELLWRHCEGSPHRTLLLSVAAGWLLLAGGQTGFLRVSLYQEVLFWALAMASVFNYLGLRGLLSRHFSGGALALMAGMAGLALLTRVSTAIGMWIALFLLMAVLLWQGLRWRPIAGALALLVACAAMAGGVNVARWGDALTFADYTRYLANLEYPDRVARLGEYGLFNLARLPLGLVYYFVPVWILPASDGGHVLEGAFRQTVDVTELPPSSFLLTDALPLILLAFLPRLLRRGSIDRLQAGGLLLGLTVPGMLMLTAISMNYRYRMDFLPFLELATLVTIALLANAPLLVERQRFWLVGFTALGIVATHVMLLLYKLSLYGPAELYTQDGLVHYYAHALAERAFR